MSHKIGVAIITCNREDFFKKCYSSIPDYVDEFVIVNDGSPLYFPLDRGTLITNDVSKHVGESKNIAMTYLLDKGCDYIFTLEDDIYIASIKL